MSNAQRAQRALLETKLAWGDKQPEVKPPSVVSLADFPWISRASSEALEITVVRKRIQYKSDSKKKGEK